MVGVSVGLWLGSAYRVWGGFDSAVRFAHVLAQPALPSLKLIEPSLTSVSEPVVSKPWWGCLWVCGWVLPTGCGVYRVWGGFDSAVRFAHVLAQPALPSLKLVEPACECQRAGRVETSCACPGNLGGFWLSGVGWCRFGSLVCRGPAQPASGRECSRAGSTGFKGWGLDRGVVVGVLSHVHSCVVPRAAVPRPIPPGSEGSKGK